MPSKVELEKINESLDEENLELKLALEKAKAEGKDNARVRSNQEQLDARAKAQMRAITGNVAKKLTAGSPSLQSRIVKVRSQKAGKTTVMVREFRQPKFRWGNKPMIVAQIDPNIEVLHAYEGSYNEEPRGGIDTVIIDDVDGKAVKTPAGESSAKILLDETQGAEIGKARQLARQAKEKATLPDKKPEEKIL